MADKSVMVLGHPFAHIGRGYDARLTFKAIKKAGINAGLYDIYKYQQPNAEQKRDLLPHISPDPYAPIQIFTLNADEIKPAMEFMGDKISRDTYKIIYPQWELERYPAEWAAALDLFDEVWAPAKFVQKALAKAVARPVHYMPLTIGESLLPYAYGRRYFGLPETDFLFLLAFDFTSYLTRKNPWDIIEAFKKFLRDKEYSKVKLVLKLNNSSAQPDLLGRLLDEVKQIKDHIVIVDKSLSDIETKSLIWNCDCYISLHRSEGWGRSLAEAMAMKIPVIATDYSGNTEFMTRENSFPVNYKLVDLKPGEYPFAENQVWAQPDIDHAAFLMNEVYFARYDKEILSKGLETILEMYSIRSIGLRLLQRIGEIEKMIPSKTS